MTKFVFTCWICRIFDTMSTLRSRFDPPLGSNSLLAILCPVDSSFVQFILRSPHGQLMSQVKQNIHSNRASDVGNFCMAVFLSSTVFLFQVTLDRLFLLVSYHKRNASISAAAVRNDVQRPTSTLPHFESVSRQF